ncbi:hypothetical protein EV193_105361 [Herbihabitans rhizosphaerae]|uniref:Uncharacterized protein n=1 Tax=Herbihabitans rhizosphaerae TaxID=1872711 RepID=A0A4Q7KR34_9PSEU|nr:hypothetical protein [Herbihabitans rhizosphaerae]RZS37802.1 hypothetical protein EV193_105361 [Herbihabitans rhizosphaerae]
MIVTVIDEQLSRAVVVFVWSDPRRPWPSSDPDAVARVFGPAARDLLGHISGVLAQVDRVPVEGDLALYGRHVTEFLAAKHPELTESAREAIAARCTYAER